MKILKEVTTVYSNNQYKAHVTAEQRVLNHSKDSNQYRQLFTRITVHFTWIQTRITLSITKQTTYNDCFEWLSEWTSLCQFPIDSPFPHDPDIVRPLHICQNFSYPLLTPSPISSWLSTCPLSSSTYLHHCTPVLVCTTSSCICICIMYSVWSNQCHSCIP